MRLKLPSGRQARIGTKFHQCWFEQPMWVGGVFKACGVFEKARVTGIKITILEADGVTEITREAVVQCRDPEDSLYNRKWALTQILRSCSQAELPKADRTAIFMKCCPQFFMRKKSKKALRKLHATA